MGPCKQEELSNLIHQINLPNAFNKYSQKVLYYDGSCVVLVTCSWLLQSVLTYSYFTLKKGVVEVLWHFVISVITCEKVMTLFNTLFTHYPTHTPSIKM